MKHRTSVFLACAASIISIAAAHAAGIALPGDRSAPGGGPGAGAPGAARPAGPPAPRVPDVVAVTPSMDMALKAAQAIAAACKQYQMALAVVDSEGVAKLVYVPDGSAPWHGYSAIRKAYTAVTFKSDSSKAVKQAATDPAVMDRFKADPNLARQSGGLVLMAGDKVIGAIGVSGAEPGGHDEECGAAGLKAIQGQLK